MIQSALGKTQTIQIWDRAIFDRPPLGIMTVTCVLCGSVFQIQQSGHAVFLAEVVADFQETRLFATMPISAQCRADETGARVSAS
jgi:hypothetical protein